MEEGRTRQELVCEICKSAYSCSFEERREWRSCAEIGERVRSNRTNAVLVVGFLGLDLMLLVLSCIYARNDAQRPDYDPSLPRFFLVYIAMLLATGSLLYGSYDLVGQFLLGVTISPQFGAK